MKSLVSKVSRVTCFWAEWVTHGDHFYTPEYLVFLCLKKKKPGKQSNHGHLFFACSGLHMVTIFKVQTYWCFYAIISESPGKQSKHGHLFFGRSGFYMVTILFKTPKYSAFWCFNK